MLRGTETMLEDKIKTITDDLTKKVEAVGPALEGALQFMGNAIYKLKVLFTASNKSFKTYSIALRLSLINAIMIIYFRVFHLCC